MMIFNSFVVANDYNFGVQSLTDWSVARTWRTSRSLSSSDYSPGKFPVF